ncbi:MAG: ATP-dependent zinc metalloprotease FtsH [Propionibacteriaceae bacterium]|jgi:cell division protease FtsH|nr:ATP-dependent zinc metalloprotease FtsH [Propionibacteriaceae bacterium]
MKFLKTLLRSPFFWVLIAIIVTAGIFRVTQNEPKYEEVPTSQAIGIIMGGEYLKEVILTDNTQLIQITKSDDSRIEASWVGDPTSLVDRLNERAAQRTLEKWNGVNAVPGIAQTLLSWLPLFLILGIFVFFMLSTMGGGAGGRAMSFGRSRAKMANKDTPKTTFADVAGVDEAVEELQEIKEFLEDPGKFKALGAKIPKGVLLYGPPGTGKTLLARAVAGEAGVPFYSISGSDFVEMFVGVGASRVRDLFDQAKSNAPAIVFIDEIDAVGRHRGAGMGGGHDEREQTLNQLLVEMDGFDVHGGVILIAATNRPDVLDPALLRPGRFDRQIAVDAPDLKGRFKILKVHATGKPLEADVDLEGVARRTPGFTGADLANVLNEAALLAARTNLSLITNSVLDESIDRVIAGPQKRTRVMNSKEILITAYHEGGHALVAAAMPGNDPVQKITILPRGKALGYTMVMPDQDKYSQTRGQLLDQLAYIMGGRAAEELIFHDPTTGASNDIEKATKLARAMVTQYGMTESLGAVRYGAGDREPFVGMEVSQGSTVSPQTAATIDAEVAALINNAHQEAFDALVDNRDILDELVRQLLEHETLDKEQVAAIFKNLRMRPARPAWTGSDTRRPSLIPPIPEPYVPEPVLDDETPTQEIPPQVQAQLQQVPPTQWPPPGWPVPPTPQDYMGVNDPQKPSGSPAIQREGEPPFILNHGDSPVIPHGNDPVILGTATSLSTGSVEESGIDPDSAPVPPQADTPQFWTPPQGSVPFPDESFHLPVFPTPDPTLGIPQPSWAVQPPDPQPEESRFDQDPTNPFIPGSSDGVPDPTQGFGPLGPGTWIDPQDPSNWPPPQPRS